MPTEPAKRDTSHIEGGEAASRTPDPRELARMAERLEQVDELSQFLVAMRDAVRSKTHPS